MAELHAVSDLQQRYGLASRQAVYDRLKALKIKPVTRGNLSSEQLDKLDQLDKWLKANPGYAIANFPRVAEVIHESSAISYQPSDISHQPSRDLSSEAVDKSDNFADTLTLIESIAKHIAAVKDPLQHYTSLERACASGWLLSTGEVRSLTGVKPTGDRWQRGSFVFIKAGKIGAQSAWRVVKVVEGSYKI